MTQQRCTDCSFRGTKKRVKIRCMQHYCKCMCECMLLKSSRDAIYDHQVSKGRAEEHGGADRWIYCVDRTSYPALCLAMAWEDPPPFGETRLNRRGRLDKPSAAQNTITTSPHLTGERGLKPRKGLYNRVRMSVARRAGDHEGGVRQAQPRLTLVTLCH